MLELQSVSKEYEGPGGRLTILEDIDLRLNAGDAAVIMGPSGTGKSTLLYILGALEPPSSGKVYLDGRDVFAMPHAEQSELRNRQIGFVFQDHCLLPQCSVLENVLVPTLVDPGTGSVDRAKLLLNHVGLGKRMDHRPGQLSGGEKQRAAVARALIRQPRLVLCDEPTGNLDESSAEAVTSLLLDLHQQQNSVLVVVTHSARVASRFPIRFELTGKHLQRTGS